MNIRKAKRKDKVFILDANVKVNLASGLSADSSLSKNFEKDLFGRNKKFKCFIIEEEGKPVAFFGYAYTYWLNKGQGVYLSNIYVTSEYRRHGLLKEAINFIKVNEKDVSFITVLVGDENQVMQKAIAKCGGADVDMKTYYIKFDK